MKRALYFLLLLLTICIASCQPKSVTNDYVGKWYSIDLDNNVDTERFLIIGQVGDSYNATYTEGKKVYSGVLIFSAEQRGIVVNLQGLGKVVVRKVKATSALSMEQQHEFEDIPLGFFQKRPSHAL